jgi:hypothetical protein
VIKKPRERGDYSPGCAAEPEIIININKIIIIQDSIAGSIKDSVTIPTPY